MPDRPDTPALDGQQPADAGLPLLRAAVARLAPVLPMLTELGERFAAAGHELALVGGPVRDAMLGRLARPRLHHRRPARRDPRGAPAAGPTRTGTSAARSARSAAQGRRTSVEITTYRSDAYDRDVAQARGDVRRHASRATSSAATSPSTRWRSGCPSREFVDPYGGLVDLAARVLRTPGSARGLLLRRPAADDAGRPVRRPARLRRRTRGASPR